MKSLKSKFNVWYLDEAVLANVPSIVFNDFQEVIELSSKIDLSLNYKKCELLIISDNTTIKSNLFNDFSNIAPGISLQVFDTISPLPSHSAYFLLKNSLSIP
jgi:hypothetical protein